MNRSTVTTFLFTDVEGSTRLWEQHPEAMRQAMTLHDAVSRGVVSRHGGTVVKMTGDGVHAAFGHAAAALAAMLELQQTLARAELGVPLALRCGLHAGADEYRDNDYYGPAVNRAARIMAAAHGGQMLVSQLVVDLLAGALPGEVTLRDLGSVRLRDLARPEHLYQVVHPALRAEFPPLRSLEATPNNLVQQLNSFIGRELELSHTRQMLSETRLLTLVGFGGIGKSRLSAQLAADVLDDFPDGVWFIELASVSDGRAVPLAVAGVLGLKEDVGRPIFEVLTTYLRDKRVLLVLDNCEHLIHGCADLAKQLLQAAPQLKLLASSREPLQIAGEATFHLAPLTLPAGGRLSPEALARHEAVRLFIERAVAAQPAFRLTEGNAAAVTDICRQLDGIPLAIELAAARTRALPIDALATRLHDRFRLLSTADRTVQPRQRTLRALIDWSYDLLTERERTVFERLAVFAGGWTLEAAEAVASCDDIAADEVLDLLTLLVEKSLVVLEADSGRYRMLDTVHRYAAEKLAASGEQPRLASRHLQYFVAHFEAVQKRINGPEQGLVIRRIDADRANLLAALAHCDHDPDGAALGLRLVLSNMFYFQNVGALTLGYQSLQEALARLPPDDRGLLRARACYWLGHLGYRMGKLQQAFAHFETAAPMYEALGRTGSYSSCLQWMGAIQGETGDVERARANLQRAVQISATDSVPRNHGAAQCSLGLFERSEGHLDVAAECFWHLVNSARAHQDIDSETSGLLNLAIVELLRPAIEPGRQLLADALELLRRIESVELVISGMDVSAGLAVLLGRWDLAARFFGVAEALSDASSMRRAKADAVFIMPLMERARAQLGAGYDALHAAGRALPHLSALEEARGWVASLTRHSSRADRA